MTQKNDLMSLDTRSMTIGSNLRPTFATRLQSRGLAFSRYRIPTQFSSTPSARDGSCVSWLSHQPRTDVRRPTSPNPTQKPPPRPMRSSSMGSASVDRWRGALPRSVARLRLRQVGWAPALSLSPPRSARLWPGGNFSYASLDWIECRKELWVPLFWGTDVSLYMYPSVCPDLTVPIFESFFLLLLLSVFVPLRSTNLFCDSVISGATDLIGPRKFYLLLDRRFLSDPSLCVRLVWSATLGSEAD